MIASYIKEVAMHQVEEDNPSVFIGGEWTPESCKARHHVALIVPYRDRFLFLCFSCQKSVPR